MFESVIGSEITLLSFIICLMSSIVLGLLSALVFTRGHSHSSSWAQSLALLPPVVTLVIMMVNGNIGAGLAVAGTFALVRFRSAPGSAREITALFFTVAVGLSCGMGYVGIAAVFFVIISAFALLLSGFRFGEAGSAQRQLKITIPENLDYDGLFDDLFRQYTRSHELVKVRTTNMGTLYELTYMIELKEDKLSKQFIDDIRCRNGNLNIICGKEMDNESL